MGDLSTVAFICFILCILAVCAFEFVNGFHDTANAVATVIYTGTLQPNHAVIWAGIWNFLGVCTGGVTVAMGIVKLLPLADIMSLGIASNIAMIAALLIAAIFWNVFTWYYGIPCSSSHTLFGSIIGIGIAFQMLHGGDGPNWTKVGETLMSLLISPTVGFALAIVLMFIFRTFFKNNKALFTAPAKGSKPPIWIRAFLIATCTGVSYSHGSNDGQKGVGMMMIILMMFLPMQYSLNTNDFADSSIVNKLFTTGKKFEVADCEASVAKIEATLMASHNTSFNKEVTELKEKLTLLKTEDNGKTRFQVRKKIQKLTKNLGEEFKKVDVFKDKEALKTLKAEVKVLTDFTDWAPVWVIALISLSLGIGTTIGWKRIVVTIGEKIGKTHLTYAQGMVAELMAASTIQLSTWLGKPVSTTHILSSAIAGTMVATEGVKNLQSSTIKNIGAAWVLTLPVTILVSGVLYWLFSFFV